MKQAASGIAGDRDGAPIWLGPIGDTIAASESPLLHQLVGQPAGRTMIYKRLVPPRDIGLGSNDLFERWLTGLLPVL
jgi:shikimate 5-dehydrogenase